LAFAFQLPAPLRRCAPCLAHIGIGRGLTASPLPHHRTYESRLRRFGGLSWGERAPNRSVISQHASRKFILEAEQRSPPRRMPSRRSIPGHYSRPPFRPSARLRVPTMPSADFCGAVREDASALSPSPGHPADLPWSAVIPSVHRRRIDQARPNCGWRALLSRASSPQAYHTSYPVRVPRPARSFHAAFRPHLAVTPWRFPGPSAPRTPGQGTCTPKHDSMHGTHARHEPRAPARRLQALVSLHNTLRCCYVWKKLGASGALWQSGRRRGSASEGRRFLGAFYARWFAGLRCPGGYVCGGRRFILL
jgi:hypothetical protein